MRLTIPVDPGADEARKWAEEELAKSEYQSEPVTWLDSFGRWLADIFSGFGDFGSGLSLPGILVLIVVVIALVGLVVWLVVGPMRRSRVARSSAPVLEDDARSAEEMEAAARAAAGRSDWDLAVTEIYRALVRRLDGRGVVDVSDGMTADEAARAIGAAVPVVGGAIAAVAHDFDVARYGAGGLASPAWERAVVVYDRAATARRTAVASDRAEATA
ncbi:DUF4129 domain-containing protein [Demequina sp. NBRC 110057]|uniref:DUF4129 domain-containing protein n=1 Tax=Demequina sp. NBRC 110057 TaxID=1570346 RepID=UPI0009FFEA67|nr:DUF4129 domain-containing protein [Demequina sp. NBRC 110057]